MDFVFQACNLSKSYDKRRNVLNNICLSAPRGSYTAIIGSSGGGKTTLLNIIGLLDQSFDGKLFLFGHDAKRFSDRKKCLIRNRKLGFVFQDYGLLPNASVKSNILMPSWYGGLVEGRAVERSYKALINDLGIAHLENELTYYLSGGEKQRVAVARALLLSPDLILADEPTGNLDSANSDVITNQLLQCKKRNATILLVTHNKQVAATSDRIYKLTNGELIEDNE